MRNLVNTTGYTKGEPTNNNPFNVIPGNHIKAGDKDVTLIPIVGGKPQYNQKVILRRGEPDVKFDDIVEGVLELPMAQIGVGPSNTTPEDRERMNRFWKNPLTSAEVLAGESPYVRRYAGVRGSLSDAYSGGSLEPTAPMSIFTPQQSIDNFQMPYQEEWDPRRNMSSFSEYQKTTQPSTLLNQYGRTTEEEEITDSSSDTLNKSIDALNKSIKEFEAGIKPDGTEEKNDDFAYLSAWNPYTSISTDTAFAHAGAALGKDGKELFGGVGRYAVGIGGLGKGILSASRNFLGGMAAANRHSQALAEYEANKVKANKKLSERTENSLRRGGIIGSYIDIFKEGGIKEATGNYIEGEDDNYSANTLVEAGEHILFPGGESVEVIGDRHSDKTKGELLNLPPGTKVISDYLQIGGKIAKKIKKDYDLRVTSTNKFATVIDKFKRKIGLQDLIDEEEKIIKRVAAQKDITHQDTRDLNLEFLGKKLQDIQSKKDPLEADLSEFTDYVFQLQESSKTTKKEKKKMQEGGMAEEGQADEIIQIIIAYAEMTRQDPEQLLQRLESMPPEEARAEIERIIREVQGQQGPGAAQGNQNEIQQTNMRRKGGFSHFLQSGGAVAGPNIEEVVMAYAQLIGVSPEEIMQALAEMSPEEQQQAMEQMMMELQQAQQQGQPQPQQEQPMMQMGGQAQQPQLDPEEVIVAYAQMIGVSPEEIMQELGQMEVAEQQQAFETMVYELQNSQQQQPSTMRRGGFSQFLQSGGAVAPTNLEEVVMAYAQLIGVTPEEIIQALEQMSTEEQKQAVDQMMMELQQGQPQPEQQAMMQEGGQSGPNPEDIIMAYAQLIGVTPEEIMTELEQMTPEEREQAFQQMLVELQENSQQTMMQSGGETGGPSMEEVVLIYAQMVGKDAIEIMEELDKMTPEDREQALQQMSTEVQSQVNSGDAGTAKLAGGFSDFMRDGGITYMQEGGTSTGRSIVELGDIDYDFAYINPVAAYEEYAKQAASGDGVYGEIDLKERLGVYDRLGGRFFKSVYEKDENGEYKLKEGKTVKDLQKAYQDQIKDTAAMLKEQGFSEEEINDYVDRIRFDEDGKMGTTSRLLDDKLGQFTTSRSFFQKKVVTDEQLRELNEQGIFTARNVEDNKDKVVELYGEEVYNSIVEGLDKYQNADYVLASKGKGEEPKKKEEEKGGKTNTDSDVGELSKRKPMADLPALLPDQGGHINPRMGLVTMNEIKSEDAERFAIDSTAQKRQVFDQSRLASREAASMTPYAGQAAIANINAEAFKSLNQIDSQTNIANQKDARDVSMMNTQRRAQQDLQNLQFKDNYERNTLTMLDHYVGEWNSKITRDNEENMARFNFQEQMNAYNALNPNYKRSFDGRVVVFDDSFFGGYKEAMTEEEKKKQEEEQLRNQQNIVGKVPVLGTASPKPKRKGGIVRQSFIDLLNTFKLD